jgi:hypothetical protein
MRELTDVGAGTPMGELLRRYWHPAGLVGDATLYYGRVEERGIRTTLPRRCPSRPATS